MACYEGVGIIVINKYYIDLILFLVVFVAAIPFVLVPRLKNNKKAKITYAIIVIALIGGFSTYTSIKDNPKVEASLGGASIEFNKGETVDFEEIKSIQYYEDVTLDINPNGYRWGNDDYYSGDANIRIMDANENELEFIYKGKVYIDRNVQDCIVMDVNDSSKTYIFNLGNKQETKKLYQDLIEKCFPEDY